eukprot:g11254.t1
MELSRACVCHPAPSKVLDEEHTTEAEDHLEEGAGLMLNVNQRGPGCRGKRGGTTVEGCQFLKIVEERRPPSESGRDRGAGPKERPRPALAVELEQADEGCKEAQATRLGFGWFMLALSSPLNVVPPKRPAKAQRQTVPTWMSWQTLRTDMTALEAAKEPPAEKDPPWRPKALGPSSCSCSASALPSGLGDLAAPVCHLVLQLLLALLQRADAIPVLLVDPAETVELLALDRSGPCSPS